MNGSSGGKPLCPSGWSRMRPSLISIIPLVAKAAPERTLSAGPASGAGKDSPNSNPTRACPVTPSRSRHCSLTQCSIGRSANMCNTSTAGVPTGTTKTVEGRLALIAVTALFGQMPMHRVRMMRTSRRWTASFSARRRAERRVSSFFGPYPPSSLLAHLPQSRMMVFHGLGRARISCLVSPQPSTLCL